jgi:predicted GNAT family N-acyltransferase
MDFELREVKSHYDLEAAKSLRLEVFVLEQNVPREIEMDEYDAGAIHVLCLVRGQPVGTGRLVKMPDGVKLGRVAVLRDFRGKGLGTEIVGWLLARAGGNRVYANVQLTALDFYKRLGFVREGGPFFEAGIEHVKMIWHP